MNQKQKQVAENLIKGKMDLLINGICDAKKHKVKEIKADAQKDVGVAKLRNKMDKALEKVKGLRQEYNDAVSLSQETCAEDVAAFEKKASIIIEELQQKKTELITEIWLGDLSEEAREIINGIPTLQELLGNGAGFLKSNRHPKQIEEFTKQDSYIRL